MISDRCATPGCSNPVQIFNGSAVGCCRGCATRVLVGYGPDHPRWNPDRDPEERRRTQGWSRAKKMYPLVGKLCERCGVKPATDHHHKDDNPGNNRRSNVQLLCHGCHSSVTHKGRKRSAETRARISAARRAA